MPIPDNVRVAMMKGDRKFLSRSGRHGGFSAALRRSRQLTDDAVRQRERLARDSERVAREANEHICPVDD